MGLPFSTDSGGATTVGVLPSVSVTGHERESVQRQQQPEHQRFLPVEPTDEQWEVEEGQRDGGPEGDEPERCGDQSSAVLEGLGLYHLPEAGDTFAGDQGR
jgi:hypothetical protein